MMEIDIGNLIYIIFVAVILLLNLFTKSKKKQGQERGRSEDPTTLGPPPQKGKSFEELLEEFTGGRTEPVIETTPKPQPQKPKPSVPPVPKYQSKGQAKPITEIVKEHSRMQPDFERFEEFEDEESETSEYHEDFNSLDSAQKAFVYSEIFKRKY